MSKTLSTGVLYKKELDPLTGYPNGNATVLLFKTLAQLIYMSDETTLQTTIDNMKDSTVSGSLAYNIAQLSNSIGTDTTSGTVKYRVKQLETEQTNMKNASTSGTLAYKIKQLEDSLGTDSTSGTVKYRVTQVENSIGTDTTSGTVKYRVKQLETTVASHTTTLGNHTTQLGGLTFSVNSSGILCVTY